MPTIELSSAIASRASNAYISISNDIAGYNFSTIPLVCFRTDIFLCSGVRPASTPTSEQLTSNLLAFWQQDLGSYLSPTTRIGNTVIINANPITASGSGTATWFCVCTFASSTAFTSVTGTVGLIGSGADLEISSTTISSGTSYSISGLILTLPTSWTY